jgi:hypothetical protein
MKHIKLFEEFIKEATNVTPDSKIVVDDYKTDNGKEIKSTEIVGAIVSSETEKEFEDYFYDTYGNGEFTTNDMSTLKKYYLDYETEIVAAETEEEEAEKEAEAPEEEDPLAGI